MRRAGESFLLLLMLLTVQVPLHASADSISVNMFSPPDGVTLASSPVTLAVVYTNSTGSCVMGVYTQFYVKAPGSPDFALVGVGTSGLNGHAWQVYNPVPMPVGLYLWYVRYGPDESHLTPPPDPAWTFWYTVPTSTTMTTFTTVQTTMSTQWTTTTTTNTLWTSTTTHTTVPTTTSTQWTTTTSYATIPAGTATQSITTTSTRTVGIVTQLSYLYETATSGTTSYITRTVSTTGTTSLPTTLTKTMTAFATTETTPVTCNETQSTTLTEMSYATISVTQYVYVESYNQGQVLENATIQQIPNESEASAHFDNGDKHDIQTITIDVINNATNVRITIATAPQHSEVGIDTNEYGSFEILATNLSNDNIKSVVIEFKVDKNWLSGNQIPQDRINLYRYENGEWKKLETSLSRTDEAYAYYKATSPGLSIFAIAGQSSSFLQLPGIGPIADSYVMVLSLVAIAILGTYAGIRIAKARSKRERGERKSEPLPAESSPEDQVERRLLEYITRHGGSISLSKAAEDLGVLPVTIKETISHLKSSGRLTPA
jgi:PGF-pre-PGF domain-containing protein